MSKLSDQVLSKDRRHHHSATAEKLAHEVVKLEGRVLKLEESAKRLLNSLDAHATGAFDGQDDLAEALGDGE